MWTRYDNLGPKTTNLAEGFLNSLNVRFGISHPSIRSFLQWLQKLYYEVQSVVVFSWLLVDHGRAPKQPSATYERLREAHERAKRTYSIDVGYVFATVFPNPSAFEMVRSSKNAEFRPKNSAEC